LNPGRKVVLLGAYGFVGSAIGAALSERDDIEVIRVARGDDWAAAVGRADIIIHCANPARRFQAEKEPGLDYQETVEKTMNFLQRAEGKPFLLVSSLSCRTQPESTYGGNRLACERAALAKGAAVVRLGPMFGGGRTSDTLHDIIRGSRVFVSEGTRYAYVDVAWVGGYIAEKLASFPRTGVEIGARNTIALSEVARAVGSRSVFGERDDTQFPIGFEAGPDAYSVLEYAMAEAARRTDWE